MKISAEELSDEIAVWCVSKSLIVASTGRSHVHILER